MIEDVHIDFTKRCIFLPAENTKGKKDRYVFFSQKTAVELNISGKIWMYKKGKIKMYKNVQKDFV